MRTGLNPFRYQSLLYVGFHVKISKSKHKDSSSGVERDTHLLQFFCCCLIATRKVHLNITMLQGRDTRNTGSPLRDVFLPTRV